MMAANDGPWFVTLSACGGFPIAYAQIICSSAGGREPARHRRSNPARYSGSARSRWQKARTSRVTLFGVPPGRPADPPRHNPLVFRIKLPRSYPFVGLSTDSFSVLSPNDVQAPQWEAPHVTWLTIGSVVTLDGSNSILTPSRRRWTPLLASPRRASTCRKRPFRCSRVLMRIKNVLGSRSARAAEDPPADRRARPRCSTPRRLQQVQ